MKKSELSFADGFTSFRSNNDNPQKKFDWNKAAEIIKKHLVEHPDLVAEAGLQGDWNYTGGVIFENGKPTNEHYTYLSSNWAMPTLIIEWDGEKQVEVDCYTEEDKYDAHSKWDDESLTILELSLNQ